MCALFLVLFLLIWKVNSTQKLCYRVLYLILKCKKQNNSNLCMFHLFTSLYPCINTIWNINFNVSFEKSNKELRIRYEYMFKLPAYAVILTSVGFSVRVTVRPILTVLPEKILSTMALVFRKISRRQATAKVWTMIGSACFFFWKHIYKFIRNIKTINVSQMFQNANIHIFHLVHSKTQDSVGCWYFQRIHVMVGIHCLHLWFISIIFRILIVLKELHSKIIRKIILSEVNSCHPCYLVVDYPLTSNRRRKFVRKIRRLYDTFGSPEYSPAVSVYTVHVVIYL